MNVTSHLNQFELSFFRACEGNDLEMLREIVLRSPVKFSVAQLNVGLKIAVELNHAILIPFLLELGANDFQGVFAYGGYWNEAALRVLLERAPPGSLSESDLNRVLMGAVQANDVSTAVMLLNAGATAYEGALLAALDNPDPEMGIRIAEHVLYQDRIRWVSTDLLDQHMVRLAVRSP